MKVIANNVNTLSLTGTSVTQVSASDADVGLNGRVHFELEPRDREEGSFVVDPASGVVRTNKALDRESVATYDLKALAIDGGTPPLSSTVSLNCFLFKFSWSKNPLYLFPNFKISRK